MVIPKLRADFNGLFGDLLCLSHTDSCVDIDGIVVQLVSGMEAVALEEDADETGKRDDLIAAGIVECAPDWLACNGSRWVLRIDSHGVRHESTV